VSLIGDALRKARKEAAERETDRRGVLFSAKINDSPTRSNLGLGIVLGAVIAVAATVAGGGAVWWFVGRDQPSESARAAASPANDASGEDIVTPIPSPLAAGPEDGPRPPVATVPAPASPSVGSESVTPRDSDQPGSAVKPTAVARSIDTTTGEGFAGIEDGVEIYVMEADLGGAHLSLDYIVFRNEDPFAEINGIELHLGGVVDGFRVKAIEHDRVKLSDGRRTIVLRAP
jgi:hypothetical protein